MRSFVRNRSTSAGMPEHRSMTTDAKKSGGKSGKGWAGVLSRFGKGGEGGKDGDRGEDVGADGEDIDDYDVDGGNYGDGDGDDDGDHIVEYVDEESEEGDEEEEEKKEREKIDGNGFLNEPSGDGGDGDGERVNGRGWERRMGRPRSRNEDRVVRTGDAGHDEAEDGAEQSDGEAGIEEDPFRLQHRMGSRMVANKSLHPSDYDGYTESDIFSPVKQEKDLQKRILGASGSVVDRSGLSGERDDGGGRVGRSDSAPNAALVEYYRQKELADMMRRDSGNGIATTKNTGRYGDSNVYSQSPNAEEQKNMQHGRDDAFDIEASPPPTYANSMAKNGLAAYDLNGSYPSTTAQGDDGTEDMAIYVDEDKGDDSGRSDGDMAQEQVNASTPRSGRRRTTATPTSYKHNHERLTDNRKDNSDDLRRSSYNLSPSPEIDTKNNRAMDLWSRAMKPDMSTLIHRAGRAKHGVGFGGERGGSAYNDKNQSNDDAVAFEMGKGGGGNTRAVVPFRIRAADKERMSGRLGIPHNGQDYNAVNAHMNGSTITSSTAIAQRSSAAKTSKANARRKMNQSSDQGQSRVLLAPAGKTSNIRHEANGMTAAEPQSYEMDGFTSADAEDDNEDGNDGDVEMGDGNTKLIKAPDEDAKDDSKELDYDREELFQMDYAQLEAEDFDRVPESRPGRAKESTEPKTSHSSRSSSNGPSTHSRSPTKPNRKTLRPKKTIASTTATSTITSRKDDTHPPEPITSEGPPDLALRAASRQTQEEQYTLLSMAEWQETGDKLIDELTTCLTAFKEARRQRRELAGVFEREVGRREAACRAEAHEVERKRKELKNGGEGLLGSNVIGKFG